ncbi:MAG: relaxase/mobilization nuclease domain-containing protein [Eubacteriales bacterium]|nr:relaxase/mobilization nuclease domain-containing protein [Eubacteriales bacterium]
MATTGFWPVKSRLKEVIDYADNPDKTTERKHLNADLAAALEYAENDNKTDKKMYVTGINCITEKAYEQMTATKQRYGKLGGNVAYHCFQSFCTGEVTSDEAHQIGLETARAMWGNDYEIVVTTHLNTENIHNHMIINSVSFRSGRKFENHISDHHRLREISDEICRERGKSVLENSSFYGGNKKEYWIHKSGKQSHRDMLRSDIEECMQYSRTADDLYTRLKAMGYQLDRTEDKYQHLTVKAPTWKRPIRLDSLGYTCEAIKARFEEHWQITYFYQLQNEHLPYRAKVFPLENIMKQLAFEVEHSYDTGTILVDTMFYIILVLAQILNELADVMLLSPELRFAVKDVKSYVTDYGFLRNNDIHTIPQLEQNINGTKNEISVLEANRQKISNKIRRAKTPEESSELKTSRKDITKQITPLRKKLKQAERILDKSPHLHELLQSEHRLEMTVQKKLRERSYSR